MTDPALDFLARHEAELVALRRDLRAHPELGRTEWRSTGVVARRLRSAGLVPVLLEGGSGLWCDVPGAVEGPPAVVLRADLDALPIDDLTETPWRSTVPGVCHACGHDVHTATVLGAGLALAGGPPLPRPVRLVFQPAEELTPGGALDLIAAGALDGAGLALALHCDPTLDVGRLGVSAGAITAASDQVALAVRGPGGHTARPHRTVDLIYLLARLVTDLPAALSRRVDPRAGASLVFGTVSAGKAANAIPTAGTAEGTLRVLDREVWYALPDLMARLVDEVAAPYADGGGSPVELTYTRGVPPVVNEPAAATLLAEAADAALGPGAAGPSVQSLGGEDFAWYLERVPGAMARLGVRPPGWSGPDLDLHQGRFDVDEAAIGVGVRVLVRATLSALGVG